MSNSELMKAFIPTDNAILDAMVSNQGPNWNGDYTRATWALKLTLKRMFPGCHINATQLRKHLRGMQIRGLLKAENRHGNNIVWTLVVASQPSESKGVERGK